VAVAEAAVAKEMAVAVAVAVAVAEAEAAVEVAAPPVEVDCPPRCPRRTQRRRAKVRTPLHGVSGQSGRGSLVARSRQAGRQNRSETWGGSQTDRSGQHADRR